MRGLYEFPAKPPPTPQPAPVVPSLITPTPKSPPRTCRSAHHRAAAQPPALTHEKYASTHHESPHRSCKFPALSIKHLHFPVARMALVRVIRNARNRTEYPLSTILILTPNRSILQTEVCNTHTFSFLTLTLAVAHPLDGRPPRHTLCHTTPRLLTNVTPTAPCLSHDASL